MHAPTRRDRQAEQRRNQLLDTALALFASKGYDRTSIKDLARAAEVAQSLVYHYFDSKEALLLAVIDRDNPLPPLRSLLEGVTDQPAALCLPRLLYAFYALITERQALMRIGLGQVLVDARIRERVFAFQRAGLALLAQYLDARVAAGELRPHDTTNTAQALLAGVLSVFLLESAPEPFISDFVAMVLHGVAV
jgi:AcrR family transcriptional regulator